MATFNVQAALKDGVPQAEINNYLSSNGFDPQGNPIQQNQTQSQGQQAPQQNQANPYNQGALGFLTNQAPTIGGITGAVLTSPLEALNAVLPGLGVAANVAGAAGGANIGERLKENLQKSGEFSLQAQNPAEIQKQTIMGGAGELGAQALGPVLNVASKLPVIGPLLGGIGNIGNAAWAKLFGSGDLSAVEGGASALTALAKQKGIASAGGLEEMAQKTAQVLSDTGNKLGNTLSDAASQGVGIKSKMMDSIIDNAGPSITADPQALAQLRNTAKMAYGNMINGGADLGIQTGDALFPVDAMNIFKQNTAKMARFGADDPGITELFNRDLSTAMKNQIENLVPSAKGLNQQWWNLNQIGDHLAGFGDYVSNASSRTGINPFSTRNPAMLKTIGQAGDIAPSALGQLGIRLGQPGQQQNAPGGISGPQGMVPQQDLNKMSMSDLQNLYAWQIKNNPYGPQANLIKNFISVKYPGVIGNLLRGANLLNTGQ